MKVENWIVGLGTVFVLGLVVAAVMPDDFWDRDIGEPASVIAGAAGPGPRVPKGGLWSPLAGQAVQYPGQVPYPAQGRTVAMPGLTPFERAQSEKFRGRILRIVSRGRNQGWGQVHMWVADGAEAPKEISLAPNWYLTHLGCRLSENQRVTGTAFRFDRVQPTVALYAKTVAVNGKLCRLRNDEGFAIWSNRLR